MSDFAMVKNGRVANVIVADATFAALLVTLGLCEQTLNVDARQDVAVGWLWDGANWAPPPA
ncbi:hypothetical protein [Andreprevotia lacus]|nr:hypothetical protein [Andreprevotia lacus]